MGALSRRVSLEKALANDDISNTSRVNTAMIEREICQSNKVDVLDRGFVRLIDHMGDDLSVVRHARNSYDAAWRAGEDSGSDTRLIHYLWQNHHTTPFEAVTFGFEVHAPIFVFRQWHRHRTWSFNELSARYRELPEEFYVPEPGMVGTQSAVNKQGRVLASDEAAEAREDEITGYTERCREAFAEYRYLLAAGWPRELARMVLPLSTYSHMFAAVNLLNLLKFLTLRSHSHAQYEIRVYAMAMLELVRNIVPVSIAAWEDGVDRLASERDKALRDKALSALDRIRKEAREEGIREAVARVRAWGGAVGTDVGNDVLALLDQQTKEAGE